MSTVLKTKKILVNGIEVSDVKSCWKLESVMDGGIKLGTSRKFEHTAKS